MDSRIDTDAIKLAHDLQAVVESELGRAARRSGSCKQWRCPFPSHPGDNDPSFTVYADGHYYCFGCGAHGDIITWTMQRRGVTFTEACNQLGVVKAARAYERKQPARSPGSPDKPTQDALLLPSAPSEAWQKAAMEVVIDSECLLRDTASQASATARAYLKERGLGEPILQDYHIGYNPTERNIPIAGSEGKVWVPVGVTIPLLHEHESTNTLYGINVRLSREARARWKAAMERDAKYLLASGSKRAPIGLKTIGHKTHAFVLEGEFDALLTIQTLRAMGPKAAHVGAFTMGSASSQDVDKWLLTRPELLSPRRFLIATDSDGPGQKAARRWLEITPGRARLWPPPIPCKDITDLWQKHGYEGVRWWIQIGLQQHP